MDLKKASSAFRPPADAPIPTTRGFGGGVEGVVVVAGWEVALLWVFFVFVMTSLCPRLRISRAA
jgi:hypothetical protein